MSRNDGHYESIHGAKHQMRSCAGSCGATIPAFGGKKWCPDCEHKNRVVQQRESDARRRAKRRAEKLANPTTKDGVRG